MTAWEASTSVVRAWARAVMKRCTSALMAWSWRLMRAQDGMVRKPSVTLASVTALVLAGRWVMARSAVGAGRRDRGGEQGECGDAGDDEPGEAETHDRGTPFGGRRRAGVPSDRGGTPAGADQRP